jgi:hypothetical protein
MEILLIVVHGFHASINDIHDPCILIVVHGPNAGRHHAWKGIQRRRRAFFLVH